MEECIVHYATSGDSGPSPAQAKFCSVQLLLLFEFNITWPGWVDSPVKEGSEDGTDVPEVKVKYRRLNRSCKLDYVFEIVPSTWQICFVFSNHQCFRQES